MVVPVSLKSGSKWISLTFLSKTLTWCRLLDDVKIWFSAGVHTTHCSHCNYAQAIRSNLSNYMPAKSWNRCKIDFTNMCLWRAIHKQFEYDSIKLDLLEFCALRNIFSKRWRRQKVVAARTWRTFNVCLMEIVANEMYVHRLHAHACCRHPTFGFGERLHMGNGNYRPNLHMKHDISFIISGTRCTDRSNKSDYVTHVQWFELVCFACVNIIIYDYNDVKCIYVMHNWRSSHNPVYQFDSEWSRIRVVCLCLYDV